VRRDGARGSATRAASLRLPPDDGEPFAGVGRVRPDVDEAGHRLREVPNPRARIPDPESPIPNPDPQVEIRDPPIQGSGVSSIQDWGYQDGDRDPGSSSSRRGVSVLSPSGMRRGPSSGSPAVSARRGARPARPPDRTENEKPVTRRSRSALPQAVQAGSCGGRTSVSNSRRTRGSEVVQRHGRDDTAGARGRLTQHERQLDGHA
jgi:hypothetical protein